MAPGIVLCEPAKRLPLFRGQVAFLFLCSDTDAKGKRFELKEDTSSKGFAKKSQVVRQSRFSEVGKLGETWGTGSIDPFDYNGRSDDD